VDAFKEVLHKLGSTALDTTHVAALQSMWGVHQVHIHDHHSNEDEKIVPWIKTRVKLPDRLTAAHADLMKMMDALQKMFHELRVGSTVQQIEATWDEYIMFMKPHLYEEEQFALPLMRAYFSSKEYSKKIGEILTASPPEAMGSFWYWLDSKKGDKASITSFMAQEGIPCFVYYIAFKAQLRVYEARFVNPMEALLAGKEWSPTTASTCSSSCAIC